MLTHSTTELITAKEISTNILFLMEKNKTKPHKNVETCRVAQKTRLEQWGHPSPYRQDRCPLNLPGGMCRFISQDIFISCSACRAEAKLSVKHPLRMHSAHRGAGHAPNWPSTRLNCLFQQAKSKPNPTKGKIPLCEGACQIPRR